MHRKSTMNERLDAFETKTERQITSPHSITLNNL